MKKCTQCLKADASKEMHECPYEKDHGNKGDDDLCNCCEECVKLCERDVELAHQ